MYSSDSNKLHQYYKCNTTFASRNTIFQYIYANNCNKRPAKQTYIKWIKTDKTEGPTIYNKAENYFYDVDTKAPHYLLNNDYNANADTLIYRLKLVEDKHAKWNHATVML